MLIKNSGGKSEEHNHTDRYLITYADLITLLLGLFVILYVTAQVDDVKYKEVVRAFSEYFQPEDSKNIKSDKGSGVLIGLKDAIPEPILVNKPPKSIRDLQEKTEAVLSKYIDKGLIILKKTSNGLSITLPEMLLFNSGRAEVQPVGVQILDTLASVLNGVEKQVTVDGHTDSEPINNFRYASNWHLSVARALSVGYSLITKGLPESNVVIRGFGAQRPIVPNTTEEGKSRNRRVEITITDLPPNAPSTQGYSAH